MKPPTEPTQLADLSAEPISAITWQHYDTLHSNDWNPNRVHKREMQLLERSLLSTGWIQPVLANREGLIIDGFHRWRLSQDSPQVKARYAGLLPVAVLNLPTDKAMAMTIRINRAKGTHVAVELSKIVRHLLTDRGWTELALATEIGATLDEVRLLAKTDVFDIVGSKDWAYSKAWYPVELSYNADGSTFDPRAAPPVVTAEPEDRVAT